MKLLYENVDITNEVIIRDAIIEDSAGGRADIIEILFNDSDKLWRKWQCKKGDKILLELDSFSSGLMYLDEIYIRKGSFRLKAISLPFCARTPKTRFWENIGFTKLANDLANDMGLELVTYNIDDWTYEIVEQFQQSNLEFLNERCIIEGYRLKINDNKAIIYKESALEKDTSVLKLTEESFIDNYEFKTITNGLYSSCIVSGAYKNNVIKYEFKPTNSPYGPILRTKINVTSIAEAERFSKNMLRFYNKNQFTGSIVIELNSKIASGNVIEIQNIGDFSGIYFVEQTKHLILLGKTLLKIRKVLEEY